MVGFDVDAGFVDGVFVSGVGFILAAVVVVAAGGLLLAPVVFERAKPEASSGGGASSVCVLPGVSFESVVLVARTLRGGASLIVATSMDGRRGGVGAFVKGAFGVSSALSAAG